MSRCINLKYEGKTYELTFTRETVKQAEDSGFDIRAFAAGSKPATMNPLLFYCAFLARNKKIKRNKVDEIYEHIEDKKRLFEALVDLYAETLAPLVDDAEVEDGKKVEWDLT